MSTTLIYNGVTIQNCLTKRFSEEPQYDESNTDLIYHRVIIEVVGYIHLHDVQLTGVDILPHGGSMLAERHVQIRRLLLHPRGELILKIGSRVVFNAIRAGGALIQDYADVNNGPKPLHCNVVQIAGESCLKIEFAIEAAVVDCSQLNNPSGVLNNRWSLVDEYDTNWFCTRTIEGTLRVAGASLNPHAFRHFVFPPLQYGFIRDSIRLISTPDMCTLRYTITDKQVFAAPPAPATTWTGKHSVLTSDGVNTFSEMAIMMNGPPKAVKREMIAACMAIVDARAFKLRDFSTTLESAAIVDHMHENRIECQFRFRHNIGDKALKIFALNDARLGLPLSNADLPGYNQFTTPVPKYYGEATPVGLFAAFLQSPCDDRHRVPQDVAALPDSAEPPRGGPIPTDTYEGSIHYDSEISANYSAEHRNNMYTHYQVDSHYDTNQLRVPLPIAAASNSSLTDTVAVIALARPITKRTVRVAAERLGEWPSVPEAKDMTVGNLSARLLHHTSIPKAPKIGADGKTVLYSIDAEYVYSMNRAPQASEALVVAALPWDNRSLTDNVLPPDVAKPGIA